MLKLSFSVVGSVLGFGFHLNYYKVVKEKDRSYYEVYSLPRTEQVPEGYKELSFVCIRPDGMFESSSAVGAICRMNTAHQIEHLGRLS